ncbi:hypothetical protein CHKEEEPN_4232 [Methylorubrum podarium]|nr:hypothetical protein CHKEEEPN_4232 [Methylorubrum podarium]
MGSHGRLGIAERRDGRSERFGKPQTPQRPQRRRAHEGIGVAGKRQKRRAGARILQLGQALGGSDSDRLVGIGERARKRLRRLGAVEAAEREGCLSPHIRVRVRSGAGEVGHRFRVGGLGKRQDGDAAHGRIAVVEVQGDLGDVAEILERIGAQHRAHRSR